MNQEPKKNEKPESSETNEQNNGSDNEEKSEEFLNFEHGLKAILGLTKEQVEEVKRNTPYPKKKKNKDS